MDLPTLLPALHCLPVGPLECDAQRPRALHPGGFSAHEIAMADAQHIQRRRRRADAALGRSLFVRRMVTAPTIAIPVLVGVVHVLASLL